MNVERGKIVAWRFVLSSSDRDPFSWVQRTVQLKGAVPYLIRYLLHVVQPGSELALMSGRRDAFGDV